MKGARLIVPGCTGFDVTEKSPEPTLLHVLGHHHYRVWCATPDGCFLYIPFRNFILLNFPREADERS